MSLLSYIYVIAQLRKNYKIKSLLLILLFFITNSLFSQATFRRHFIIAYDVSTPFIKAEKNTDSYKKALINLFSSKPINDYNEAYQDNLSIENKNGLIFFDKEKDEISFFHFNIAKSEFDRLRWTVGHYSEDGIVSEFSNFFLKDKNFNWSTYKSQKSASLENYINDALSKKPTPENFSGGVSMSNFVYPLILDKIDTTTHAEEYILIILSDFKTGSALGNTEDLNRVKDIYQIPYNFTLPPNSPVSYIKRQIDYLSSQYYKIDFFQYSFKSDIKEDLIGILSYKIKPKIGVLNPEDVALFVDGDLNLNQQGYHSQEFKTNQTKIKFTHNKNLIPTELKMSVSLNLGDKDTAIFDDVIANLNESDNWVSEYTDDDKLMSFDSSNLTYYLPKFDISVDSIINKKNFQNLIFKYQFKTKYLVGNNPPLNFIYDTERNMPVENINYSTKATIIIMTIVLPLIILIGLLIFLAIYGKPRTILLQIDGYLDSFEKIDYENDGKLLTPYKAWNSELQDDLLIINGSIEYKSPKYPFNWNSTVYLQLKVEKIPSGFEMFLKPNVKDINEIPVGMGTAIKKRKNNELFFAVGIRQTDITKTLNDPETVKFTVETVIRDSILFIKSDLREILEYKFQFGLDLQDVWVGFDPGTTGSCIAVGSSTDNIILGEDIKISDKTIPERKIIPSVIAFDKQEDFHQDSSYIPENIYKHGNTAYASFGNKRYQGFQSIKKLLGFKDTKTIVFYNNNTLLIKGKYLAALLIKGLFNDINTYFNRPQFNADDYKRDGKFNPLRAVVAIPNNFTTTKIQDIIDCIYKLGQFKEVRYVYEAEAVLFYYLSNFSEFSEGAIASDSETILVFDMGGATINATIVTSNKTVLNGMPKYEIDFLAKIGYGIGGDTIDYCIIKFILSFTNEIPELIGIDIFEKKAELAALALDIKKEIISNYYSNRDILIPPADLERYINKALGLSIKIDEHKSAMFSYFVKSSEKFKLFEHPLFINIIYNNVKDAVNEVFQLAEHTHIDKIVFSGRSTSFPMIKETVEKQLDVKKSGTKAIALKLEESKIAVAKGACWYGINKNSVILNNLKTNAAFGFKKTQSVDKTDVKFYELVEMGCNFDITNDGIDSFQGVEEIEDDFAFDGNKVNFYQIMGKDANKILSKEEKHKFSKIATIKLDKITSKVAIKVNENDEVECAVILHSGQKILAKGFVADQEIDEANEEHYTWIVK